MNYLSIPKILYELNCFLQSRNPRGAGRQRKQRRGRKECYTRELILLLLLLQHLLCKSMNVLFTKLKNPLDFDNYRQALGVNSPEQIPHRTQFARRLKQQRFKKFLSSVLEGIIRKTISLLLTSPTALVLDMTDIALNPKKHSGGAWGWCSKGRFFGLKLSLLCFPQGLPVAFAITPANLRETAVVVPLLTDARNILRHAAQLVEYVIADCAYDSENFARAVKHILQAQAVFSYNKRRGKLTEEQLAQLSPQNILQLIPQPERARALAIRYGPDGNRLYSQRVFAEHVYSHFKEQFNLNKLPHHLRGINQIKNFIKDKIFTYIVCGYCNVKHGLNFRNFAFTL